MGLMVPVVLKGKGQSRPSSHPTNVLKGMDLISKAPVLVNWVVKSYSMMMSQHRENLYVHFEKLEWNILDIQDITRYKMRKWEC